MFKKIFEFFNRGNKDTRWIAQHADIMNRYGPDSKELALFELHAPSKNARELAEVAVRLKKAMIRKR